MFEKNVGLVDCALRIIVGAILLNALILFPDSPHRYWMLVGIFPLMTGFLGSCPIYSFLGISTKSEHFDY